MGNLKKYVLVEHGDSGPNIATIAIGESNLKTLVEKTIFGDISFDKERLAMMDSYMSNLKDDHCITFEGDPPLTLAELSES